MSNTVKLSSKLAADEDANGLDHLSPELIENPRQVYVAVVWLDTQKVTTNTDDGSEIPTVRVRRIEPIGKVEEVSDEIRNLIGKVSEARTGKTPLPFDADFEVED